MRSLKFFLEIRVIQNINLTNEKISSIYLMQDAYIDKLMKNYQININLKASSISLSVSSTKLVALDVVSMTTSMLEFDDELIFYL